MESLQYIVYYGDAFSKRRNQTLNFGLEKKGESILAEILQGNQLTPYYYLLIRHFYQVEDRPTKMDKTD